MSIRNLSLVILSLALFDVASVNGMRPKLLRSDSLANFYSKASTCRITPQEYIKMVQDFAEVNMGQPSYQEYYRAWYEWQYNDHFYRDWAQFFKDIGREMTEEYNGIALRIRNIGETFGYKEYPKDASGNISIISIDISWPNLKRKIIDFLNSELRNNGKKWESFGNILFNYKTGAQIQDIHDLENLKDDQPITLQHLDALIPVFDVISQDGESHLEDWQINLLTKLCLKIQKNGENRLFDLSDLAEGEQKYFEDLLKEMLRNKTGFQRIMSLLSIAIINNERGNIKITFDKKELTGYRPYYHKININLSETSPLYGKKKSFSTLKKGKEAETIKELSLILLHEISHAYHRIIGYDIGNVRKSKWFSSFSILNAPVNLISEFFPMLLPENMNEVINKISDYIKGVPIDDNQKIDWIYDIMYYGFGTLLFDNIPSKDDLKIDILCQNEDFIAKCIYITACVLPIWNQNEKSFEKEYSEEYSEDYEGWYDDESNGDFAWTNPEERLTIRGNGVFMMGDRCYMVEDRQNEQIYAMRNDTKEEKPQYYYRFHFENYEKAVENNLKDILSDCKKDASNGWSRFWGNVKSRFDSWKIKTNVSAEGLSKFKEQANENVTRYKMMEDSALPILKESVNLNHYELDKGEDINLIKTDIENGKLDLKGTDSINLKWDSLWKYGGTSLMEKILETATAQNVNLSILMSNVERLTKFYVDANSLDGFKLLCNYEIQAGWSFFGDSSIAKIIVQEGPHRFTDGKFDDEFQKIWTHAISIEQLKAAINREIDTKLKEISDGGPTTADESTMTADRESVTLDESATATLNHMKEALSNC